MLYDSLLVIAIWMIAGMIVVIPLGDSVAVGNPLFQVYLLLATWLYFAICWRGGKTLGMKAWRIRIKAPEQPMGWGRTAARFGLALVSLLPLGLGFWWSIFHPTKATWHDLASSTRLVVVPKAGKPEAL
jgi:uncharacterized RDD family membrane protein YckC